MCFGQGKRSYGALRQQTLPYRELAENIQVTYTRERKCLRPRFVVWDLYQKVTASRRELGAPPRIVWTRLANLKKTTDERW